MTLSRGGSDEQLLAGWRVEHSRSVTGWDFGHLVSRMHEDTPPWDFTTLCRHALPQATRVLDMGTGGGEQLLSFVDMLPGDTVATEGWPPNLSVARAALTEQAIPVVEYDAEAANPADRRMPFEPSRFDLVLNRHEAMIAAEVARILVPDGVFLTQQVGGDDARELHTLFGTDTPYSDQLKDQNIERLRAAGMTVDESAEWTGQYRFHDVAALVAYLRLVPWDAPADFTVDRYADQLLHLHHALRGNDIPVTKSRFWLRARR